MILSCGGSINFVIVANGLIGSSKVVWLASIMVGSQGVPYYRSGISDAMVHLLNRLLAVPTYKISMSNKIQCHLLLLNARSFL